VKDERNFPNSTASTNCIDFGTQVTPTNKFIRDWKTLSPQMQRLVKTKVELLSNNPRHPSLKVHRLRRLRGLVWECYISNTHRLLYQQQEGQLYLHSLGKHELVDKCHLRNYRG
jgi:mRNA interferase RelE/StbE